MTQNKSRIQFLLQHILRYKYQFIIPIFCMIGLAVITPLSYYIGTKFVIDEVIELNKVVPYFVPENYSTFNWSFIFDLEWLKSAPKIAFNFCFKSLMGHKWYEVFIYMVVPLFFVKAILMYARSWRVTYIGHKIICDFQAELYEHFLKLPIPFFNKSRIGEISSSIISDVYRIQEIVTDSILQTLQNFFIITTTIIILLFISPSLTLIALVGIPIAMAPLVLSANYLKKKSRKSQEETANISSHIYETISSIKIIKIFNKEKTENIRFTEALGKLLKILYKSSRVGAISSPLVEFLSIFYLALFVAYGCSLVESGVFPKGSFIAFIVLVFSLFDPVKKLSRMNNKIANSMAALDRIMTTLSLKGENYNPPHTTDMPTFKDNITFKDLSFSYDDEKEVLKNVTFKVPKGKTTALVGLSGSGKTTLVNLLPCFYDIKDGDILIDGVSIKLYNIPSIRKNISLVSQDILLFNESVAYNICYGKANANKEEIIAAAKKANAHEFIIQLPNGYDTIIGEKASRLSGGQKQRLSIARALLVDTPILILDEATSALDVQSEKLIQNALEELMNNRTTIIIAHRLSTVKNADQIVVLDKGRVENIGKHDELMASGGLYKSLYNTLINIE
jgi:subfamily B ATP-binding cassette protein MsbA